MSAPKSAHGNGGIEFASLFGPGEVLCHTEIGDRNEAFRATLKALAYQRGIGNVDEAFQAVLAREEEASTILTPGLAMPHARIEAVKELVVGILTIRNGIAFAPDQPPVKVMILMLVPKDAPGLYLQAMSSLARIMQDPETTGRVAGFSTADEIWRFFKTGGAVLPDYVCAGDICERKYHALNENDPLERAIDLFVKYGVVDLPVTDKDGELVGSVTAYELLRVCLPDYILWMEDLSPILNFEPFAEILRNETNTWLAEIMNFDYAVVGEDAPAIEVAKEITKHNARVAYVVRGKKLVGIISLQEFLHKVLRE